MLRPQVLVLALAGIVAVVMILFPPWWSSLESGTLNMGEVHSSKVTTKFAGYGFAFSAGAAKTPFCSVEFYCSAGIDFPVLGLELLVLAGLAGAGWWLGRARG